MRDWPLAIGDIEAALAAASPQLAGPLRRRFAVHEAGHAIAAIAFKLGTVTSVRIDASGGTTQIRRDLMGDQDEIYFHDELTMTMAGRAADAEILGSVREAFGIQISTMRPVSQPPWKERRAVISAMIPGLSSLSFPDAWSLHSQSKPYA